MPSSGVSNERNGVRRRVALRPLVEREGIADAVQVGRRIDLVVTVHDLMKLYGVVACTPSTDMTAPGGVLVIDTGCLFGRMLKVDVVERPK